MIRLSLAVAMISFGIGIGTAATAASGRPAYRVVSEDLEGEVRKVAVRLDGRAGDADLTAIAGALRAKKTAGKVPQTVAFYLPGMSLSEAPWADVRFDPAAKVVILGLRFDEELAFRTEAASDPRPLAGVWLTSPPAIPGKLSIWRERSGKAFAEWQLRNGQKTIDELIETRSQRGRRFEIKGSDGGYYLALWNGALELGDKAQVIAVAERLTIDAPQVAKSPAVTGPVAPAIIAPAATTGAAAAADPVTAVAAPLTQITKPVAGQKSKATAAKPKAPASKTVSNLGDAISGVFGSN